MADQSILQFGQVRLLVRIEPASFELTVLSVETPLTADGSDTSLSA